LLLFPLFKPRGSFEKSVEAVPTIGTGEAKEPQSVPHPRIISPLS